MQCLLLISVFAFTILQIHSQILNLPLGAKCEGDWVCTTQDRCTALGPLGTSRPKICKFMPDNKPVLCCPNDEPKTPSKISEICTVYNVAECQMRFIREVPLEPFFQEPAIVGGFEVEPRTHRHMALIGYGDSLNSVEWQCGGSIISKDYILSAAHCAESPLGQIAKWVRVGDLDVKSIYDDARPETLVIAQRIIHPNYKSDTSYNDIAIFRLERSLIFNSWVGPVCLSTEPVLPYTRATVTGWGRTDFVGDTSSHLLAVDVPLVDANECKQLLGKSRRIPNGVDTDTMICAGERDGGKDACSGDSGGPLVVNSTSSCLKNQIGIISFGRMCALPNTPGVYTRIYPYLSWIQSIAWP